MNEIVMIGDRSVGGDHPTYIIGEIGINHNGDIEIAKKLIDAAAVAGVDAVKFQKRTPELCVPPEQRDIPRETPWGVMTYMEYRRRVEFGQEEYEQIGAHCASRGVHWFASCWDGESLDFMERFSPVCYKIPSALITRDELVVKTHQTGRPIIMSTGMSLIEEIDHAVSLIDRDRLCLTHCTSAYPCKPELLNLRAIETLHQRYGVPTGYSGHEVGLQASLAAVTLGACILERHITLDRAMWGSDQAASVEPGGLFRLVRDIRVIEAALGDGVKTVYDEEMPIRAKLRG